MGYLCDADESPRSLTRTTPVRRDITSRRLLLIDGLRGIAALWVLAFHLSEGAHIEYLKARLPDIFSLILGHGYLGVPIFFVLSGYVMFVSTASLTQKADVVTCSRIILRRLVRLAPPYYVAVTLAALVMASKSAILHESVSNIRVSQVLSHFIYAQDIFGTEPLSPVFWTLAIEVQFYIFFAGLLWLGYVLNRRFGFLRPMPVLIGCSLLLSLVWISVAPTIVLHGIFVRFWYSFALGAVIATTTTKKKSSYLGFLMAIAVLAAGMIQSSAFVITTALTSLLLLYATSSGRVYSWLSWWPLQFIGACSYSIYLFHSVVTGISSRLIVKIMGQTLSEEIVLAIAVPALCIMFAYVCYRYIELPAVRWSHRFKPARTD